MMGAHIGDRGTRGPDTNGWPTLWLAEGRSSALFAVLGGVTIALMARRSTRGSAHTVVRIAVRGGLLIGLGYALEQLDTPPDVVLANLGVMFILVLPVIGWPRRALLALAALAFVAGSVVARAADGRLDGWPVLETLVSHHYPAVSWVGYVLVGMAVGRAPLARGTIAAWLAGVGALTMLAGYGVGMRWGSPPPWSTTPGAAWTSVTPHSGTVLELVGNTGCALVVLGFSLAVVRTTRWFAPLLAFGSMSLTMYSAHLVMIWWASDAVVWRPSNVTYVTWTVALVAAASLWRAWLGAGPLERVMTRCSTWCANTSIRARP